MLSEKSVQKLKALGNKHVESIISHYAKLCRPSTITVLDDSEEDSSGAT